MGCTLILSPSVTEISAAPVPHVMGETAIDTLRRRCGPADLFRDRVEYAEILGVLRHDLAPEFERILSDRQRELIHEAFDIDGVVVDVDAAPKAGRDVRIAHRMLDQQVRY